MFQLRLAAAGDVLGVSITRDTSRITEANWRLNAKLDLDRAQRRGSVQSTGATGRDSEAILAEHADESP